MFIYNFNLSKTNIFKIIFVIFVVILIIFFGISAYRIFTDSSITNSNLNVANITSSNYTNILKAVHENLDTYVGQTIKFSGYVYRVSDFSKNEFVLARDMLINDNSQSLIVGFLCNCKEAEKYLDKTWVEITGTITKGDYHGEIPVLQIIQIDKIQKPSDEFVFPPDDFYIPTSALYYDED